MELTSGTQLRNNSCGMRCILLTRIILIYSTKVISNFVETGPTNSKRRIEEENQSVRKELQGRAASLHRGRPATRVSRWYDDRAERRSSLFTQGKLPKTLNQFHRLHALLMSN